MRKMSMNFQKKFFCYIHYIFSSNILYKYFIILISMNYNNQYISQIYIHSNKFFSANQFVFLNFINLYYKTKIIMQIYKLFLILNDIIDNQ